MRLPAEQRREQLLAVSCEVFAERGFSATSMDDIAIAAGVTKPVLYQHFTSKRALYLELIESVGADLLGALEHATAGLASGRDRVESGFAAYYRFVMLNPNAFRLLFGASVRNNPEFGAIVDRIVDAASDSVTKLIEIDAPDEQRRVLAHALVGMAEATSRRALARADAEGRTPDASDADQLAHWLAEMAWFGLRGVRA